MELLRRADDAGASPDLRELVAAIPYCRFLGVIVDLKGSELTTILPYSDHLIGNAALPALHGGVLGGFMEITAVLQIIHEVGGRTLPKPVDVTTDYLRSGRPVDTYGRATITKLGRRVVNVHVEAWQDAHAKPVATLRGHFLLAGID
jgi:acyl-coenzyme A thioesterase PaaI-like protein